MTTTVISSLVFTPAASGLCIASCTLLHTISAFHSYGYNLALYAGSGSVSSVGRSVIPETVAVGGIAPQIGPTWTGQAGGALFYVIGGVPFTLQLESQLTGINGGATTNIRLFAKCYKF